MLKLIFCCCSFVIFSDLMKRKFRGSFLIPLEGHFWRFLKSCDLTKIVLHISQLLEVLAKVLWLEISILCYCSH